MLNYHLKKIAPILRIWVVVTPSERQAWEVSKRTTSTAVFRLKLFFFFLRICSFVCFSMMFWIWLDWFTILRSIPEIHHYLCSHFLHLLAVKTRNSARHTAMTNDLATKRARCEQIKKVISDQRNKVDECTTVISKCLHGKFIKCVFSSFSSDHCIYCNPTNCPFI